MKKTIVLIVLILGVFSCTSTKTNSDKKKGVGVKQKTQNPNTPYIYKNGYLDYKIQPKLTVIENDSTYINELKFNAVFTAMYTKKLMFDNFGKWDKEIRPNNERHPILIWERKKLFENDNTLYSIAASGEETWEEIYASVIVYDNENKDCLSETYTKKDALINYFSDGIKNLKTDNTFYDVYWDMVNAPR